MGSSFTSKPLQMAQGTSATDEAEKAKGWISFQTGILIFICAVVSGYATFSGIRLFLDEVGDVSAVTNGTAVLLTLAVTAIFGVSWGLLLRWGPEAPTFGLRVNMLGLGAALFAITVSVSSLSNVLSLAGPSAKVHDWRITHAEQADYLNALETRVRGIAALRPSWLAERDKACTLAGYEIEGGTVSGSGAGAGPVAAALSGVCQLTASIVGSLDDAAASIDHAVVDARTGLAAMQSAIRDRSQAPIDREGIYLIAGDQVNAAIQDLRAVDLLDAIDAAALQVSASVAELSGQSGFSDRQVASIASIREGLSGLAQSTAQVSDRLRERSLPDYSPVTSPDYLEAVLRHALRFIPIVGAAMGIDAVYLWSLGFHLTHRAGIRHNRSVQAAAPDITFKLQAARSNGALPNGVLRDEAPPRPRRKSPSQSRKQKGA